MRLLNKITKILRGSSRGVSAIEAIVALGILGVVAVAFLSGVGTSLKAVGVADERSVAQSLATSQMEYVKSQDYSTDAWAYRIYRTDTTHHGRVQLPPGKPSWWDVPNPPNPPELSEDYTGWAIEAKAEDFDADDDGDIDDDDKDIRKITVTVKRDKDGDGTYAENEKVFTLVGYKVNR